MNNFFSIISRSGIFSESSFCQDIAFLLSAVLQLLQSIYIQCFSAKLPPGRQFCVRKSLNVAIAVSPAIEVNASKH